MDIQKTKRFYDAIVPSDLCDCAYCKNYSHEIEAAYPQLSTYLKSMGIDIVKPFEAMPLEPDSDGNIEYIGVQYIVLGDVQYFQKARIGDVTIDIAVSHPNTNVKENHFVIEIYPIHLKWVMQTPSSHKNNP